MRLPNVTGKIWRKLLAKIGKIFKKLKIKIGNKV